MTASTSYSVLNEKQVITFHLVQNKSTTEESRKEDHAIRSEVM